MAAPTPVDTRQNLMQIAIELIWHSNYDNVGIAEICKQAGVTKGAFYHHFVSKADLFVRACVSEWESVRSRMDEDILAPRFSAPQQLENVIELLLEQQGCADGRTQIHGCPFFTAAAQAGCDDVEVRSVAITMSDNGTAYFTALARNLVAEDCLLSEIDAEQTGRILQQFVLGLLMHGRIHQDVQQMRRDLRQGLYQIVGLQPRYRQTDVGA